VPLVLAASLGGALGALLRWWLGELLPPTAGFPWLTLAVNVTGSFALGALPAVAFVRARPVLPVLLGPGLLGGFTTLSAYAEEGRTLLADGRLALAAAYLSVTLLACVAAVALAHRLSTPAEQQEFEDEEGNE
jgi:CrcB protein